MYDGIHDFTSSISSLAKFLDKDNELTLVSIRLKWEEITGTILSTHSKPIGIKDTQLKIAVDSASSLTAMKLSTKAIVKRIRENGYDITTLKPELVQKVFKDITQQVEGEHLEQ